MASKILLISANRCGTPDPVFPLGLAHLNAALRQAGHETRWFDLQTDPPPCVDVVREYRPDFVGVSLRNVDDVLIARQETFFGELAGLCASVRQAHPCPVVLGGSGFSLFPERLLELSRADFGIQGEGEVSFIALLEALSNGGNYESIPGLVYRRGAVVVANPPRQATLATSLSAGDRPPELISHYLRISGMLNVQTQRGCGHACCYCTYPLIEGRTHRPRAPEAVAEEMAALAAQGAKYVFIVDSIFNSSAQHAAAVCEALAGRALMLRWGCFLRPQGLTHELMHLMARAGLAHIEFGSDSFCDSVLEAYQKQFTFADIHQSSELARREGIDYCHFLICGGPGETLATLQTGFTNSQRLNGAVIMAVVGMRIYPGTALHRRALAEGCIGAETELLTPAYYVAPGLSAAVVFEQLRAFARRWPNWIVGDPVPAYARLVERLRRRGVVGPLWSYLAMLQRMWPPTAPASSP
jgi:radical SAM superfamily enzyme YgiQ (UPF0313 family)